MKVLISGASGLVGSSLVPSLFSQGYTVQALHRNNRNQNAESTSTPFWDTKSLNSNETIHAIVHLAGENVASGRWSSDKKKEILNSRVAGTRSLVDYIATLEVKPKTFLCASAIGYYGNRSDELLHEKSSLGEGFLADVCRQWEQETDRLSEMGVRVVTMRFGMILSPHGGALHKMIPAFQKRVGGIIGTGQQYMSWISIRDIVQIVDFLIQNEKIAGPINIVSPSPATNLEFTKTLAQAMGVPAFLKIPGFVIKTVFGQMGSEMLLSSSRVTPRALQQQGYQFQDTNLLDVLNYCLVESE